MPKTCELNRGLAVKKEQILAMRLHIDSMESGNDGWQKANDSGLTEFVAAPTEILFGQIVIVEVDAKSTVDLKIHILHWLNLRVEQPAGCFAELRRAGIIQYQGHIIVLAKDRCGHLLGQWSNGPRARRLVLSERQAHCK